MKLRNVIYLKCVKYILNLTSWLELNIIVSYAAGVSNTAQLGRWNWLGNRKHGFRKISR